MRVRSFRFGFENVVKITTPTSRAVRQRDVRSPILQSSEWTVVKRFLGSGVQVEILAPLSLVRPSLLSVFRLDGQGGLLRTPLINSTRF